jgi:hypothetical protein
MTTGAGNDIEKATDLARRMVCEWGMSEKLGPMTFGKKEEEIFSADCTQWTTGARLSRSMPSEGSFRQLSQSQGPIKKYCNPSSVAECREKSLDGSEIDDRREFGGTRSPAAVGRRGCRLSCLWGLAIHYSSSKNCRARLGLGVRSIRQA